MMNRLPGSNDAREGGARAPLRQRRRVAAPGARRRIPFVLALAVAVPLSAVPGIAPLSAALVGLAAYLVAAQIVRRSGGSVRMTCSEPDAGCAAVPHHVDHRGG